jgi:AhpC/TSA family
MIGRKKVSRSLGSRFESGRGDEQPQQGGVVTRPKGLMLRFLAILMLVMISTPAAARALVGAPAPSFSWTDIDGRSERLDNYQGRLVVLEWTSPVCPYSQYRYDAGTMQSTQQQVLDHGGVWLTILSSGPNESGYLSVSEGQQMQEKRHAHPTALVRDTDSSIAKLFGTKSTPSIAIIDIHGVLVYSGGFDSSPVPWADDRPVKNYVLETLEDLRGGQEVRVPVTRAYGCMIHYAH